MTPGLTVQETAEKTGLSGHTLRYYERIGLIWDVARDGSGHRRYSAGNVDWLILLNRLRSTGLPISGLLRYADLARAGSGDRERMELLLAHRARVAARVAELTADLEVIDRKIDMYRGRLDHDDPVEAALTQEGIA